MAENNVIKYDEAVKKLTEDFRKQISAVSDTVEVYNKLHTSMSNLPSNVVNQINAITEANKKLTESQNKLINSTQQTEKARKLKADADRAEINAIKAKTQSESAELTLNQRKQRALEQTTRKVVEQSSAYLKLQTSWRNAQRALADSIVTDGQKAKSTQNLQREFDALDKKIKQVDSATKNYSKNVGNYSSAVSGLSSFGGQLAGALGWAGALATVVALGKSALDTTRELQILDKSMELGAKTTEAYASNVRFLNKVTEDYGLELITTSQAYNKFYIASKNKLAIEDIQLIFDKVSKSASLMGISVYEQEGIFKALEQMMSKGTVQAEELRGQLGDRLPGAFEVMAKAMGVTTAELGNLMREGKVISSEVLPKFAIELEKTFGADQVTRVENLTASQNRLKNAWTSFIDEINGSGNAIGGFATSFLSAITQMLQGLSRVSSSWSSLWQQSGQNKANRGYESAMFDYGDFGKSDSVRKQAIKERRELLIEERELNKQIDSAKKAYDKAEANRILPNWLGGAFVTKKPAENVEALAKQLGNVQGRIKAINDLASGGNQKEVITPDIIPSGGKKKNKGKSAETLENERIRRLVEIQKQEQKTAEATLKRQMAESEQANDMDMFYSYKQMLALNDFEYGKKIADLEIKDAEQLKAKKEQLLQEFLLSVIEVNKEEGKVYDKAYDEAVKDYEKFLEKRKKAGEDASQAESDAEYKRLTDKFANQEKLYQDAQAKIKENASLSSVGFGSLDMFFETDDEGNNVFLKTWENLETTQEKVAYAMMAIQAVTADAFNAMKASSDAYFENQFNQLEKEYDVAVKYAGDSEEAKRALDEQYAERKLQLRRQQAKEEKNMAIFSAVINIATGITASLAQGGPVGIVLAALIGALGAVQIASIASQPLPAFWKGTDNAPEGWALTQEKGAEVITDRQGNVKTMGNNKGAQLTYLSKGDKVYKNRDDFFKSFNSDMSSTNVVAMSNDFDYQQIDSIFGKHIQNIQPHSINFDERGMKVFIGSERNRTELLNKRINFKKR